MPGHGLEAPAFMRGSCHQALINLLAGEERTCATTEGQGESDVPPLHRSMTAAEFGASVHAAHSTCPAWSDHNTLSVSEISRRIADGIAGSRPECGCDADLV